MRKPRPALIRGALLDFFPEAGFSGAGLAFVGTIATTEFHAPAVEKVSTGKEGLRAVLTDGGDLGSSFGGHFKSSSIDLVWDAETFPRFGIPLITKPSYHAESGLPENNLDSLVTFSASLGGCDNVYAAIFVNRPDAIAVQFAYSDGFVVNLPGSARSYSRTGVGCSAHFGVTATVTFANGQVGTAYLADNHNRNCSECGASIAPISVVNAADFRTYSSPDSIATIFGANLTTTTASASILPLPANLAGVQVTIDGLDCGLFFVSPNQINFHIPANVVAGLRSVRATNGAGQTFFGDFFIQSQGPGVFTKDSTGEGAAAGYFVAANGQLYAVLYATGITPEGLNPSDVLLRTPGGTWGATWVGFAPGFVGLVQINVPIPASTANGQGAQLIVGAVASQGFLLGGQR